MCVLPCCTPPPPAPAPHLTLCPSAPLPPSPAPLPPLPLLQVRAKQHYSDDVDRIKHMPIVMHGDGAFAGQGIVYECLDMSGLPEYTVGGTIHIVVNNQVAFTTDPKKSRSSPYCTGACVVMGGAGVWCGG